MQTNQRIVRCDKHGLDYNAETGRCPDCAFDALAVLMRLVPKPRRRPRGCLKFTCPFCGSKTMYENCTGKSLEEVGTVYHKTRQTVYDVFRSRGYKLRSKQLKGLQILDGIRFTETKGGYLRGTAPAAAGFSSTNTCGKSTTARYRRSDTRKRKTARMFEGGGS